MKKLSLALATIVAMVFAVLPAFADDDNTASVWVGTANQKQFYDGYSTDREGKRNPVASLGVDLTHRVNDRVDVNGCAVTFIDVTDPDYGNYVNETDVCASITVHGAVGPGTAYLDGGAEVWWQDKWTWDGKALVAKLTPGYEMNLGELAGRHALDLSSKFEHIHVFSGGGGQRVTPKAAYSWSNVGGSNFDVGAEGGAFVPFSGSPYGRDNPNEFVGASASYTFADTGLTSSIYVGHVFGYSKLEGESGTVVSVRLTKGFNF